MERETGLEPATSSLGSWHSTTELLPRSVDSATNSCRREIRRNSHVSPFFVTALGLFGRHRQTENTRRHLRPSCRPAVPPSRLHFNSMNRPVESGFRSAIFGGAAPCREFPKSVRPNRMDSHGRPSPDNAGAHLPPTLGCAPRNVRHPTARSAWSPPERAPNRHSKGGWDRRLSRFRFGFDIWP